MNILFLTQIVPYPPDAGPKVKTWHVLRYLAKNGHRVILVTFCREEEKGNIQPLEHICHKVIPISLRRSRIADIGYWLKSNFSGRPFLVERDDLPTMRKEVERVLASEQIDIIHADQLTMAQFAFPPQESANQKTNWPFTVFDAHNAVWTIVDRIQESVILPLKPVLKLEAGRIFRFEEKILLEFDRILAVSQPDKHALLQTVSEKNNIDNYIERKIDIIPIAVDTADLTPTKRKIGSRNILTLGTLHYPPNADGIRWFATEIFPIVLRKMPDLTLTIIGKNPPPDFIQLAKENPKSIKVTGYVSDLTPYFEAAAMLIVPVRAGGGIRVRILEAFARAMPVVTTTVGLEGIEAHPDRDVLVKDNISSFADAVIKLVNDDELQDRLARNGRLLAESKYDWQMILSNLNKIYKKENEQQ